MKFHPVALALGPKVTHPFSQLCGNCQRPSYTRAPIGNIELGEPQDTPSRDNPLSHRRSSSWLNLPWQGSPVHALPIPPASLAREEQINLHWYQMGFVQVTWLHLFARFGGARVHEPGWAQGPVALQCMRRRRHSSRAGVLGRAHCTRASVKSSCPALAHQSAAYLDTPLPLGPAMAAVVLGWGWRLLCGRIGCFYEVLSAGKKQTAGRGCAAAGLQGCREETPLLRAASLAAGSIPPSCIRAASPGPPAPAGSAARSLDTRGSGSSLCLTGIRTTR